MIRPAGPAATEWTGDLEELGVCPICASPGRELVFDALRDHLWSAPGTWRMFASRGCGSHYLDPRPPLEAMPGIYASYYSREAANVDDLRLPRTLPRRLRNDYLSWRFGYALPSSERFGRWATFALPCRRRRWERLVRGLRATREPGRLLDVGCGGGEFLARMRGLGWRVTGQEVDPRAAAAAEALDVPVHRGPLSKTSFVEPFDAITLHHVIEHVHDPVALLGVCHHLLAPSGVLWLATPNVGSLGRRRFGRYWLGLDPPRHLVLFSRSSLDLALSRAGFGHRTVRPDLGAYGSSAASAALCARVVGQREIGRLRARAEDAAGDLVTLLLPRLREDLVARAVR